MPQAVAGGEWSPSAVSMQRINIPPAQADQRLADATDWLATLDTRWSSIEPASADASFRRYFRWQAEGRSLILMDAPPPQEDCRPFVRIAALLADSGVHVPRILAQDLERGFLVLDDLGRQTWLEVLNADNADALFEQALQALVRFQRMPGADALPSYDDALLRRELQLFPDWYLQHHLGVELNEVQRDQWQRICDLLVGSALAQPRVFEHRDYMPRNMMLSSMSSALYNPA